MTRKRKAPAPSSRPEQRGPPGPSALLAIAGLPAATAAAAAATINNDPFTGWRAIAASFPERDTGFYADEGAILDLAGTVCAFAARDIRDENGIRAPSRIAVAYVAGDDHARLWDVFGHAVWPIRLAHPDWSWPNGRDWRHSIEAVRLVLKQALTEHQAGEAEGLRLRLEARRRDDPLLLPGRNFHLEADGRLVDRFRAFMRGELSAGGVGDGIPIKRFAFERLAKFYTRMGGAGQKFAVDERNFVFAKANVGQDGGLPDFDQKAPLVASNLQKVLEGRYRFGVPLEPDGFQHDVQRENGDPFHREPFHCVTKGRVLISGDHTNIFGSDVVTGKIVPEQ